MMVSMLLLSTERGQIAEAVILSGLPYAISEGNFPHDEKFGFREGLSADFQLLQLMKDSRNALEV